MMQTNLLVELPDHGRGLSSKMKVLPFRQSWLNREDEWLRDKLRAEVEGIAAWAVEGARQLAAERNPELRFPMPVGGVEEVRAFALRQNVYEQFLEARFTRAPGGWVTTDFVWQEWKDWKRKNAVRDETGRNWLPRRIVSGTSWGLIAARRGTARGIVGLVLRATPQDEID
jgi:phage/plasmid-associated DNA primase